MVALVPLYSLASLSYCTYAKLVKLFVPPCCTEGGVCMIIRTKLAQKTLDIVSYTCGKQHSEVFNLLTLIDLSYDSRADNTFTKTIEVCHFCRTPV